MEAGENYSRPEAAAGHVTGQLTRALVNPDQANQLIQLKGQFVSVVRS